MASLSTGKIQHLRSPYNEEGVIAGAAIDQRGPLAKSLASARGCAPKDQHPFIEHIGAERETWDLPFFLEFVGYGPAVGDEKGFEYAMAKPAIVTSSVTEFSKPHYRVDVLKVEVPVNAHFAEGSSVFKDQAAYTRVEAPGHFRKAAAVATRPFIYLSAGVSNAQFIERAQMVGETGANHPGLLCGRATSKEGTPVDAKQGLATPEDFVGTKGVKNILWFAIDLRSTVLGKAGEPASAHPRIRHEVSQ